MCKNVLGDVFKSFAPFVDILGLGNQGGGNGASDAANAAAQAKAEADRVKAEAEKEKAAADAKNVASLADQANKDLQRRQANRLLLNGTEGEEEDPLSSSVKKAKRSSLLKPLS